jgi:hypothetical protein
MGVVVELMTSEPYTSDLGLIQSAIGPSEYMASEDSQSIRLSATKPEQKIMEAAHQYGARNAMRWPRITTFPGPQVHSVILLADTIGGVP